MKTITHTLLIDPRVAAPSDGVHPLAVRVYRLIDTLDGALRALLARKRRRRLRRRGIAALSALDDLTLRDIGIGRGEIRSVIAGLLDPATDDRRNRGLARSRPDRRAANENDRRSAA